MNYNISKGLSIFWTIYMLFFAIPFPMLLYYNIKSNNMPNMMESDPWLSLSFVAVSVLLWIILLIGLPQMGNPNFFDKAQYRKTQKYR